VLFADLIGDGGEHRIRIRSGQVECWPNLGHGNFGAPYSLEGAPVFGPEFTASQLYLADLDGSGPNDLIYACADRVEVYLNQSGNSFAPWFIRRAVADYLRRRYRQRNVVARVQHGRAKCPSLLLRLLSAARW
jgi:hypothetical protein